MALTELSRFLPRHEGRNRFLRGGNHQASEGMTMSKQFGVSISLELPPGATFDPDPQSALRHNGSGT
jgi:putative (di)nucleoside polyphosphate hydrolase